MKSVVVQQPGGLDKLAIVERPDPTPKTGEILVKWHATSLNFHDFLVAIGGIPVPEGRIPMSDGAGEIVAVGEGVSEWKTGDQVMSLFFQDWMEGKPTLPKTRFVNGETVDGFITEMSCVPPYPVPLLLLGED